MTVVQTIFVFVLVPAGLYAVVALLTLWPNAAQRVRYRPGQQWTFAPVWWSAKPEAASHPDHGDQPPTETTPATSLRTARGGASGRW